MKRSFSIGLTATLVVFLSLPQAHAGPTPYFSHAWVKITNVTDVKGNITWLSALSPLPGVDATAGVDSPGGIDSDKDEVEWSRTFTTDGGPVDIKIPFDYGYEFNIASGDYGSTPGNVRASLDFGGMDLFLLNKFELSGGSSLLSSGDFLEVTAPAYTRSSWKLTLNLSAGALYNTSSCIPCIPPIPAPVAVVLASVGAVTVVVLRRRRVI
jgi:hypothetical protein